MISRIFSLTTADVILRGGRFVFLLAITHLFTQDVVGLYGYWTSLLGILTALGDLGVSTYIIRARASGEIALKSIYSLLYYRIFLTLLLFAGSFAAVGFEASHTLAIIGILLLMLSDSWLQGIYCLKRGEESLQAEILTKTLTGLLYASSIFLLMTYTPTLGHYFLFYGVLYAFIALRLSLHLKIPLIIRPSAPLQIYQLLKPGLLIFAGSFFTLIYFRIDILMIEYFIDLTSTGGYVIASRFLELTFILPSAISAVLLPRLARSEHSLSSRYIGIMGITGILLGIVLALLMPLLFPVLLPETFQDVKALFLILLLGLPSIMINNYLFTYFVGSKKTRLYVISTLAMLMGNVILNAFTIPVIGPLGAAISTVVTEVLGTLVALYLVYRYSREDGF